MLAKARQTAGRLEIGKINKREAAVLELSAKQIQTVLWDFSVDGGAIGDISFGVKLPANSVITDVWSDEQTAVTGAAAVNVKLIAGSTDLTTAEDITADAGIQKRPLASSAEGIKLSAASELKMNIATNAATAGKVRWCVEFYISK